MTTDIHHSGIVGLSPISVGEHHARAIQQFDTLAKALRSTLADLTIDIQHIGGTAIANLTGRPTIDVLLIVRDLYGFDQRSSSLAALGYLSRGDGDYAGQRRFKLGQGYNCEAELYVYEAGDRAALHHLLLRDYLRSNTQERARFAELKKRLAERHPTNTTAYIAGKRPRLQRLLEQATGRR